MYTQNEIEEAIETMESEGWVILMKHWQETQDNYISQLIDSGDSSKDDILKGGIRTLRNDVLSIRDDFQKMLKEKLGK